MEDKNFEKQFDDFIKKDFNEFKIYVSTQLAVINSKIDGYNEVKTISEEADKRSRQNELDIRELGKDLTTMQDENKWISRTAIGAIIISLVELVFILIKKGVGL